MALEDGGTPLGNPGICVLARRHRPPRFPCAAASAVTEHPPPVWDGPGARVWRCHFKTGGGRNKPATKGVLAGCFGGDLLTPTCARNALALFGLPELMIARAGRRLDFESCGTHWGI